MEAGSEGSRLRAHGQRTWDRMDPGTRLQMCEKKGCAARGTGLRNVNTVTDGHSEFYCVGDRGTCSQRKPFKLAVLSF